MRIVGRYGVFAFMAAALFISASLGGCIGASDSAWALEMTQISGLNAMGFTGKDITVGIVDTGIDAEHPEFRKDAVVAWLDLVNGKVAPYDDEGHGTHVAGIIAARGASSGLFHGVNIKGAAPDVKLVVVKAIAADGSGNTADVAAGINFCVEHGADVICLSLGGGTLPILGTSVETACNNAIAKGVFVVAAAGNAYPDSSDVSSPASAANVIAVGAIDKNRNIYEKSSKGDNGLLSRRSDPNKKPELVAPGVMVSSAWSDGEKQTYASATGTSQATPFVAAAIALMLEAMPQYRTDGENGGHLTAITAFKNAFMRTAFKCPGQATPHDNRYGYGLLQALDTYNTLSDGA
ncbi:MAG: hypothetical protein CVT48_05555 [Thermoplasmata archaeon HGW-Thermoplasmata-1]|nr:MAG: hypothetical protein CVT48_05555 [Thermoplasmata archaeon HGW-Thermoplasmata-1]